MAVNPTNGYCTGTELKAALGISDTDSDAELEDAINTASRAIDRYCSRRFWQDSADRTVYLTARHATTVLLPPHPELSEVATVTSVEVDTSGDGTFSQTWTEDTHFFLAPRTAPDGVYRRLEVLRSTGRCWPAGSPDAIKIVGTFGRDTIPDQVLQACVDLAAFHYKKTREAPFDVVGVGFEGAAVRTGGMPSSIRRLIDPFRLPMVG